MSFQDIAQWPFNKSKNRNQRQKVSNSLPTTKTTNGQLTNVSRPNVSIHKSVPNTQRSLRQYSAKVLPKDIITKTRGRVKFSSDLSNKLTPSFDEATASHFNRSSLQKNKSRIKSSFSLITYEIQQFQKLVSDVESTIFRDSVNQAKVGQCPEATWKARILIRSVQDADHDLCAKLDAYERSILAMEQLESNEGNVDKPSTEVRLSKMSYMKMKRDYDRSRNALEKSLTSYEQRQKAEVNQLNAISWKIPETEQSVNDVKHSGIQFPNSEPPQQETIDDTDFFDKAMRQRDLERINESLKTVNGIYEQLALLVNSQQENIDKLEDNVEDSRGNFEAAAENLHCFYQRQFSPFLNCGFADEDDEQKRSMSPITTPFQCIGSASGSEPIIQSFDPTITFSDTPRHWRRYSDPLQESCRKHRVSRTKAFNDDYSQGIRIEESFHWAMPFETMREDIESVQKDILSVGKGIVSQASQGLKCGQPERSACSRLEGVQS